MKVISSIYLNQKINILGSVVKFENGKADISDKLFVEIEKEQFPGIEREDGTKKSVPTKDSVDADATIKEMSESYMEEIDRLKKTINQKDQLLSEAKQEAKSWRDLCSELQSGKAGEKEVKEKKKKEEKAKTPIVEEKDITLVEEIEKIKEELVQMSLSDLTELAMQEGIDEVSIIEAGDSQEKLIDVIIEFYTKK